MSFDTTASYSGVNTDICVLLDKKLKEIFQSSMSPPQIGTHYWETALMGASSSPNTQIFQRLSDNWNKIDKNKYKSEIIENTIANS